MKTLMTMSTDMEDYTRSIHCPRSRVSKHGERDISRYIHGRVESRNYNEIISVCSETTAQVK